MTPLARQRRVNLGRINYQVNNFETKLNLNASESC